MAILTEKEVRERLAAYDSEAVTQEIYNFGSMLLQECIDRLHKIDSKAGTMAGFSVGVLALIVSTFHSWSQSVGHLGVLCMFFAAVAILLTAVFSISAMSIRVFEQWFSTNEWMKADCLSNAEKLRKYHILTMFGVIEEHEKTSSHKTRLLSGAQIALVFAGAFLALVLGDAAWFSAGKYLLGTFFNCAWIARW